MPYQGKSCSKDFTEQLGYTVKYDPSIVFYDVCVFSSKCQVAGHMTLQAFLNHMHAQGYCFVVLPYKLL